METNRLFKTIFVVERRTRFDALIDQLVASLRRVFRFSGREARIFADITRTYILTKLCSITPRNVS